MAANNNLSCILRQKKKKTKNKKTQLILQKNFTVFLGGPACNCIYIFLLMLFKECTRHLASFGKEWHKKHAASQ